MLEEELTDMENLNKVQRDIVKRQKIAEKQIAEKQIAEKQNAEKQNAEKQKNKHRPREGNHNVILVGIKGLIVSISSIVLYS